MVRMRLQGSERDQIQNLSRRDEYGREKRGGMITKLLGDRGYGADWFRDA